jgi:hypothetical protein
LNYQERLFRMGQGYECEPTTIALIASVVISAVSGVASVQQQKATASAQAEYQQQQVESSNKIAAYNASQLRIQEAQQAESQARDLEKARLASQSAKSTATVAAGEAGVSGASVDALLAEYDQQLGRYSESVARQGQLNRAGTQSQIDSLMMGASNTNLQINGPVNQPQYAAAALKFAGEAAGAYGTWSASRAPKTPATPKPIK